MVIRFGLSPETCHKTFALIWINGGEPKARIPQSKRRRSHLPTKYYFLAAAVIFLATIAFATNEYDAASAREPILSKEKVAQQANLTRRGQ
jgi:hypothetical protein